MTRRDLIKRLIAGEPVERCGLWLGNPNGDTWPILHQYFGTATEEEFRQKAGDDVRWISPQFFPNTYLHPEGRRLWNSGPKREKGARPPLADCRSVEEVEAFPWPNPDYLNFAPVLQALQNAGDVYRLSGFWTSFYHDLADLFGMEEYFIMMYTHPEVVHAATEKVCRFYCEANSRFFDAAKELMDAFFFGNDFGTQLSLICGLRQFDEFILPWFKQFTQQAKSRGYQVVLHSCGSIYPVIERLIAAGVQCLHPLQALAVNMDAETLARDFKGRIAFMGAIDTQQLLTNGSPEEVRAEVRRVRKLLAPNYIISPSHEAVLPNVPPENIQALIEAAHEY